MVEQVCYTFSRGIFLPEILFITIAINLVNSMQETFLRCWKV